MKELNTNEELFDNLFKEGLEKASSPVPGGVWESVSSSIGSSSATAIAGAAVKTALWMKAAIAITIAATVAVVVYQANKTTEPEMNVENGLIKNEATVQVLDNTPIESIHSPEEKSVMPADKNNAAEGIKSNPKAATETPMVWNSPYDNGMWDLPVVPDLSKQQTSDNATIDDKSSEFDKKETPKTLEEESREAGSAQVEAAPEFTYIKDSMYVFVPDAVTPDGDGINDTYSIKLVGEENVEIIIYNYEDNTVLFRTTNKHNSWNCKLPNGEPAPAGSYLVKVIYKFKNQASCKPIIKKLTLIR